MKNRNISIAKDEEEKEARAAAAKEEDSQSDDEEYSDSDEYSDEYSDEDVYSDEEDEGSWRGAWDKSEVEYSVDLIRVYRGYHGNVIQTCFVQMIVLPELVCKIENWWQNITT